MEPYDVTAKPKALRSLSSERTIPDESSPALRALAKLFRNSKGHNVCRRYVLERIDGELVFRQTENDAAIEAVLAEILSSRPRTSYRRRIIKLP